MAKKRTKATKREAPAKVPPLPKRIYGYWENEDKPDDRYLSTSEDPDGLVETGLVRRVGVYDLVGFAEIVNETQVHLLPLI